MAREIFVSLTHQDTPLAEALRELLRTLFGELLNVRFSTSKEIEGGIATGEDWFQWIVSRVKQCDAALIFITPSSVYKPWILWEAGAVAGAALASNSGGLRKVRPLIFQVSADMIPSPIRHSNVHFRRGDTAADVRTLITELFHEYRNDIPADRAIEIGSKAPAATDAYLTRVRAHLLDAPALPTQAVIEEWRQRLEEVMQQNRASEAELIHNWMDIAFGQGADERPQPLDLRIHGRLASLYLKAKKYDLAIEQLELARQLAPRDIFVLRQLGRARLENDQRQEAKALIDRIVMLDSHALSQNAECAALAGRWYRKEGDLAKAEEIYLAALDNNPDSYYLANVLAEVRMDAGKTGAAAEAFGQALKIIERLDEKNIWIHATAANAAFYTGNDASASSHLSALAALKPDEDSLQIVERGLRGLSLKIVEGDQRLKPLLGVLRGAVS